MVSENDSSSVGTPAPTWPPPRAPLPPHRLAKLANALGVATPIPAGAFLSPPSAADSARRPPTPSAVPSSSSITSRFLLHVLPPLTFPYDPDSQDDYLPPPPSASGYHVQFRRGVLVPVYSSFQSQLSAVAKEYALPSTAGLLLYLITSPRTSDNISEEPGPRLSDDIWRHLWTRVIQVEQSDHLLSPRTLTSCIASRSTPHLLDTASLRPFMSGSTGSTSDVPLLPNATAPSTPSTAHSKYIADSSPEDPETPDTSAPSNTSDAQRRAESLDLPGLHSPSLIPILAKVEFDIDRRKAVWYEPWLRNRKASQAKRAGGRGSHEESAEGQERQPPFQFIIGQKRAESPLSEGKHESIDDSGYQQLSDSNETEDEGSNSDDDNLQDIDAIASSAIVDAKDPLADVFGTDADTWADIHTNNSARTSSNPNVVNLALTAADLSVIPSDSSEVPGSLGQSEEEEVQELLKRISRPDSSATAMSALTSPPSKRSSSSTHTVKKPVPPPIIIVPKEHARDVVIPSEPSPAPSTPGSVGLAYLKGESSPVKTPASEYLEDDFDDQYTSIRSSTESEKRAGIIYDDLDLGLDPADDFDEDDPNDRRRSQFLLKAQLDEIERTMAQLSPRMLSADFEGDNVAWTSFSTKTPKSIPVSPGTGIPNVDYYSSSPSTRPPPDRERSPSSNYSSLIQGPPRSSSANATANIGQVAWTGVPFSSIHDGPGQAPENFSRTDSPSSLPRLALNSDNPALKAFVPPNAVFAETERRKRQLEENYKAPTPVPEHTAEDPVIPLSPDPFGRYPSSTPSETTPVHARLSDSSSQQWDSATFGWGSASLDPVLEDDSVQDALASQGRSRSVTVSRFSADSVTITGEEATTSSAKSSMKTTLMTVRSIKKLWRKSAKSSANSHLTAISGRNSPHAPPMRPERPSQETMDLPDVEHPLPTPPPNFKGYSPQPNSPHPPTPIRAMSQDQYGPSRTSQDQYNLSQTSQEQTNGHISHVAPSKQSLQVPHSPNQGGSSPIPANTPPINHSQGLIVPPQNHQGGLGLPSFVGRNGNSSPIIAAQMLPPRGGSPMNKLHFDQETPYPLHMTGSPRYSPRAVSPPSLPAAQVPLPPSPAVPNRALAQQIQQSSPVPDKDKLSGRKSILKPFQKSKTSPVPPPTPTEPRSSIDKLSQAPSISRPRRPSFHSTKSSMTSVNDIPPSPHIPEQFLGSVHPINGATTLSPTPGSCGGISIKQSSSTLTTPPTDFVISERRTLGRSASPPPLSMASSRSSQETSPSFDASQFEIVSPRTFTHPYHSS